MDYCYKCGTEVQHGEKFCKNCGADLENNFHLTGISGECDKLKNGFDNCRCIKSISLNVIDPSRIDIKCLFSSFIYRRTPEKKPNINTKNSILMTIFNIVFFVSAVVLIFTLETPAIKAVAAVFGILVAARFAWESVCSPILYYLKKCEW
ncbi:MAG: zinc ribbon domain-containing protein [Oscillospiraceae bacterium]|nr:zinc ribbon domain-containing protein [Oscillospiraceae bacterium]